MIRYCFLILLVTFAGQSLAQVDSLTKVGYQNAVALVEDSSFEQANKAFLTIMHPDKTLPDELCYYFGYSLKETGYPVQSKQLLRKYLTLAGRKGKHWIDARRLLAELDGRPFYLDTVSTPKNPVSHHHRHLDTNASGDPINTEVGAPNVYDPCGGQEFVRCPICQGSGVIVTEGAFGNYYMPCPYSDERGLMDCFRYKEYLNGRLIERDE